MSSLPSIYISVIVPTRNRAGLLAQALSALKAQSFASFEVVVVDDGSGENTREQYKGLWHGLDSRFILHHVGKSGNKGLGPSITRNIGISLARGQIIAFCDDDDFWTAPDHLEAMASAFMSNPQIDMYIANQTGQSSRGTEMTGWFPKLASASASHPDTGIEGVVSVAQLCSAGGFAHLNILSLRKNIAAEVGGFWERVSYEEDRDFFWRALDRCRQVFYNPRVIAQHNIPDPKRTDNQSTQHAQVERWLLAVLVCQHIATSVRNPSIAALARQYEGDLLRRLAIHFTSVGRHVQSFAFGSRALGAKFSFKWSGYLTLLAFKAFLLKEAR